MCQNSTWVWPLDHLKNTFAHLSTHNRRRKDTVVEKEGEGGRERERERKGEREREREREREKGKENH